MYYSYVHYSIIPNTNVKEWQSIRFTVIEIAILFLDWMGLFAFFVLSGHDSYLLSFSFLLCKEEKVIPLQWAILKINSGIYKYILNIKISSINFYIVMTTNFFTKENKWIKEICYRPERHYRWKTRGRRGNWECLPSNYSRVDETYEHTLSLTK